MQKKKKILLYSLIIFIVIILGLTLWVKITTPPVAELGKLPNPNFATANYPTKQSLISQIFKKNQTNTSQISNLPVYQVNVKTLDLDLLVQNLQLSPQSIKSRINTYANEKITLTYFKTKEFLTITPQKDNKQYQIGIIKDANEPLQICQELVDSYNYYENISLKYELEDKSGSFVVKGYQSYEGNKLGLTAEHPMLIECNIGPEGQVYNINLLNHYFDIQSKGNYPTVSLSNALSSATNNVWAQALSIKTVILGEGMGVNLFSQIPTDVQISDKKDLYLLGCGEGENDCYMYPVWHFSLNSKIGRNTVFFEFFFVKLDSQYWLN